MSAVLPENYRLLEAQLQLLEDQVQHSNGHAPPRKTLSDTDDLIALALETLERIRKRCAAVGGCSQADTLLNYWQRWHATAKNALRAIERLEALGFHPERATEFRFALNEASIATDWDKVVAAVKRIDVGSGRTRSLEEIEDELSHQSG